MGRSIGAVIAGAAAWAVPWLGGNAALAAALPELVRVGEPVTHLGVQLFLLAFGGIALSLLAGFVTATVKGDSPMGAVRALAGLQLALGLFFEISNWALLPVWYHLVFLACIVPFTLAGGRLKATRG